MSAPVKTTKELTRLAWLTELRRQGDRQCHGMLTDNNGGVCALGLLAEVAGIPERKMYQSSHDEIGALAGLGDEQVANIVEMNDKDEHTFSEIANVIEGWFAS